MAVEIPVYVDIEKTLNDAASLVPRASKPLEDKMADLGIKLGESLSDGLKSLDAQVDRVSKRVSTAISNMQRVVEKGPGTGGVDDMNEKMSRYSNTIRLAAQQMLKLGESMGQLKADGVNIRGVTQQLAVLSEQWKSMKLSSKFDDDGKLRVRAQQIIDKMSRLVARATKFGDALAGGSRAAAEAQQEHIKALTMTGATLDQLNTRLAAWKQELMNAEKGSTAFKTISQEIQSLLEQIQNLNNATKIFGSANGSINQVSTAMQSLNQQYAALSEVDRRGDAGKKLIAQYKELARYMDKGVVDLNKMYQMEQRLEEYSLTRSRTRQYEEAVLKSTANTMHRLSEQARILSERLNNAKFGTQQYKDLEKRLAAVNAKMKEMQGSVTSVNSLFAKQSSILRGLTSYASMYVSVFGLLRFVRQIRDVTGELEYQRVALGRLIQDMDYGNALFEKIKKSATESPFRIKELVTYTKQLAAYQIEEEKLFDTTKRLADVSAGLGVDMNRLILAYGQVRAASVLRGQELRQFTEAGIPLVELLAEKMGELNNMSYSTADVFKLISARAVPFSAIAEIFEDLTDKGGMFYNMQLEQSKTLKGSWEKLKDQFDIALQAIGESKGFMSFTFYNDILLKSLNNLAKSLRILPKILTGVSYAWVAYSVATMKTNAAIRSARRAEIEETIAQEAASIAKIKGVKNVDAYTAALVRQRAATTGLARSFWKLWAAMIANPWGAAIAAVLGLVAAFVSFRKASDSATSKIAEFKLNVEELANAEIQYEKTNKLISTYEELAAKTERTEEENKKLHKTMSILSDKYPDLSKKIEDETASLEDNVNALKAKNEAEHTRAVEEAEQRLVAAQSTRIQLEEQLQKKLEEREAIYQKLQAAQERADNGRSKTAQKDLEKYTDAFNKIDSEVQDVRESISSVDEAIASLDKYLNGKKDAPQIEAWKEQINSLNEYKTSLGTFQIFTPQEIKDFETVYDFFKELKKKWKEAKESADGLKAAYESATEAIAKAKLLTEWKDADAFFQAIEKERQFFGFNFAGSGSGSSSGYKQDPFISRMNERMKFMQDFKKGYDDLAKYMAGEGAMDKQLGIMEARGLSIGLDTAEQKRAAKDLSKWYEDARAMAFEQAKKHGAKGTIEDFLRQDIKDTTNRGKALKDFQKLIQSLWDAQTDLDTSTLKQEMEDALKKLEDEIKRSETARNFYHDIFDLTGDEQLAADMAVSVYGDPGKEFAERIKASIDGALDAIDVNEKNNIGDDMMTAINALDFKTLMAHLNELPEKLRKPIKDAAEATEKYSADIAKNYSKLLLKYDEIEQERVNITNKASKEIKTIEDGLALELQGLQKREASNEEIQAAKDRASLAIDAVTRDSETQLFKLKEQYRLFFSSVGVISVNSAREVAAKQRKMLTDQFVRGQISLSRYKRELEEIDEQLKKYSGLDKFEKFASGKWGELLVENLSELSDGLISLASTAKTSGGVFSPNDDAKKFIDRVDRVLNFGDFTSIFTGKKKIDIRAEANAAGRKAYMDAIAQGQSVKIANSEADAAVREVFDKYSQKMDEMAEAFAGFASAVMALLSALDKIGAGGRDIFDQIERSGKDVDLYVADFFAGISDFFGGILDFFKFDFASGFSKFANLVGDARYYNREIKDQSVLLDKLQYQYDRLGAVIEDSFGADYIYNYNKQLENLAAQAEAYRKQAEAERAKGKAADEDVAKGYDKSARDVEDRIAEMQSQLAEYFSGTDLTSAAEDFASAWIEAYKEFGSTTDAMSEKFNEMIESMINRSLAAKIMQEMLSPIFDEIDTLSKDGLLSTEEISTIAALAQERIPLINDAMTNLMSSLAAAGLDVRTTTAGFKGISRNIANASEESILGLAAAVNTQNFYMSYMPTINENVAMILSVMTGGTSGARRNAQAANGENLEVMPTIQQMVYDHLPVMDQNIAEMLRLFRSVITTKTSTTNTNYIAVK